MENNYYVGTVYHQRSLGRSKREETVLYSDDYVLFYDLINESCYTTDYNKRDFVIKDSIIPTNVDEYRVDYPYLVSRKKIISQKNTKNK